MTRIPTLLSILMCSANAFAWSQASSHSGAPLHWTDMHVVVHLDAGHPSAQLDPTSVAAALDGALATWTRAPGAQVQFQQGMETSPPDGAPVECWIRFVRDDWDQSSEQLASTQLWAHDKTGVITGAIVEVNEEDHDFAVDGRKDADDLQAVLTHELGHVLGLAHSGDRGATMFASTAAGDTHQRVLADDDLRGLTTIYPATASDSPTPADSPTAADPAAARGCSMGGSAPAGSLLPILMLVVVLLARSRRRV